MKLRTIVKSSLVAVFVAGLMATVGTANVQAAQIPYENIGTQAPTTPAFNIYDGVPGGTGNEADFVRLRTSNGDPTVSPAQNLFIDPLNATCNVGEKFDVRTYVHNGADEDFNDNGNGSAVAHNVRVAMNAQLNVTKKNFDFTSTISASNAASVTDTARLNCEKNARLKLVANTVKVYSTPTGWNNGPDSAVNGSLAIGSRVPGSGDVWGCFGDRVVVVYTVEVVESPSSGACTLLQLSYLADRRVTAKLTGGTTNAEIIGYEINWGDGSTVSTRQEDTHQFGIGTFNITGRVQVRLANGSTVWVTAPACAAQVTYTPTPENCPIPGKTHLPVNSPECANPVTPVTTLPKTGASSVAGIVAATSVAGTLGHRIYYALRRRFNV